MLTFTKAIELVGDDVNPAVSHEAIEKYLRTHAPEIADLVRKDMTAGDVHQTTALGTPGKKKTLKERLLAVAEQTHAEVIEVGTDKRAADWSIPIEFVKADVDKQLIFGWASVSEVGGQLVVDKQDDVILPEELEKAAYEFMLYARSMGDMHEKRNVGRLVESMVFTKEKQDILGIDLGLQGWWIGMKVDDAETWKQIKAGNRPEFSIGGKGERVEAVLTN